MNLTYAASPNKKGVTTKMKKQNWQTMSRVTSWKGKYD